MSTRTQKPPRYVRRRAPRPAFVAATGLATVLAIAAFVWQAERSYNGVPLLKYRTVYASLPNIGHLQLHDPVNIGGVRVGQVLKTGVRDNRALVKLQLRGVGPLPTDSRVAVRANGLLGARYVELAPGRSPEMLPDGGTLRATGTSFTNGIPETLNLFDARTRTALGDMMTGVGGGLLGRGTQLNHALEVGPESGANFNRGLEAIFARPGIAARLLPATHSGLAALDAAREDIAGSFRPGAASARPFVDERDATDDAIAAAPATEQAVNAGLGAPGTRLLASLRSFSSAAGEVLPATPTALRSATTLLRAAPEPLGRTKLALDEVPAAVPATLGTLQALRPNLAPLKQTFTRLVKPVTNLAQHGCDIQQWAASTRSLVSWGTEPGGNFGPNVGFPLTVLIGSQQANNIYANGLPRFPTSDYYPEPCEYSPGAVIPGDTLLDVAAGIFG